MAQITPPNRPTSFTNMVEPSSGKLSREGVALLESVWRQVASGYAVNPVKITQASANALILIPLLHEEGAENLATGMAFFGKAAATTTGVVTASLQSNRKKHPPKNIYKANGTAAAAAGDIVQNGMYLFLYHADLNGGAGGFVLK